jgi:hypothetical protein
MNIQHGTKAWLTLQVLNDMGAQLRSHLTNFRRDEGAHTAVTKMANVGLVKRNEDGLYEITADGRRELFRANRERDNFSEPAGKRTMVAGTTSGAYDGHDLGRTCLRPGAYDAYEKPSLIGSRRVQPRGIA